MMSTDMSTQRTFVTLGMFMIDEFFYIDQDDNPLTTKNHPQQIGGGTYTVIGARIWLPPETLGMIVDRGTDFPPTVQSELDAFGSEMWLFRERDGPTTRSRCTYRGEQSSFEYLTPRLRMTPQDLTGTKLHRSSILHFVCSPSRAASILDDIRAVGDWQPITIYEPTGVCPFRDVVHGRRVSHYRLGKFLLSLRKISCIPEELPTFKMILPSISFFSPNAHEALMLLSLPEPATKSLIEGAANAFLTLAFPGPQAVVIRSGHMGAYLCARHQPADTWVAAYWEKQDAGRVVDVTGAGNAFLGGLAAGFALSRGDLHEAMLYASVSASYVVEQQGLPRLSRAACSHADEEWNGDSPWRRLEDLRRRHSSGA